MLPNSGRVLYVAECHQRTCDRADSWAIPVSNAFTYHVLHKTVLQTKVTGILLFSNLRDVKWSSLELLALALTINSVLLG